MSDLEERFTDKLIDMAAKDRPRDSEGRVLPNWPQEPTFQVEPTPAGVDPILPFDEELITAQQYDGKAWDGRSTSYFRDKVTIAEKNAHMNALIRAQIEGRDYAPSLESLIPSRTEFISGGVDGAIARSSEAAMSVERRVRELRKKRETRQGRYQEQRASNITTTSGGVGLIPVNGAPRYVAELFADAARTKMRLASRLFQGQLPSSGNIVLVPRATTGVTMGVQASENTAPADTAAVFDTATSPVVTITGMQNVSRQLLDRGVNVDADIAASLGASFGAVLEAQVVNGAGASGELTGLLGVTGITSDTWTQASPTASLAYSQCEKLASDVAATYGSGTDVLTLVMHPRRAAWIRNNATVNQTIGTGGYGVAGLIESTGIPTNLGAGTNQDAIIALALDATPLFLGPIRFEVLPDVLSNTLQVKILAYAYVALVGARLPTSIGKLTGTGLVAPTFAS
jgi:HK97 family phage major capsid protein